MEDRNAADVNYKSQSATDDTGKESDGYVGYEQSDIQALVDYIG